MQTLTSKHRLRIGVPRIPHLTSSLSERRVCVCVCASRGSGSRPCPRQDGHVRLYSILGTTLKDEGRLLEAKGPVTDLAYSHDGAFLAVCDASKVVTVFSVADGYSVSGRSVLYPHMGQCRWGWAL